MTNRKKIYVGISVALVSYAQEDVINILETEDKIHQTDVDTTTKDQYVESLLTVSLASNDSNIVENTENEISQEESPVSEVPENDEEGEAGKIHLEAHDESDDYEDLEDDADEVDSESVEEDLTPGSARGNWYKKQQTLKHAYDVYPEVRQKHAVVTGYEKSFIVRKNELVQKVEDFSQELGKPWSSVYQLVVDELEKLELPIKSQGPLTESERIELTESQERKITLLQLKKDFDALNELYKAIDQAMAVLMQQITMSQNFEQKASENYDKIAKVLSHHVAEQLYAEMVAARENVIEISNYIAGDFSNYFTELSENITKYITLISQQLVTLKEQGLDILQPKEIAPVVEEMPVPKKEVTSPGFLSSIFGGIYYFFARVINWFTGFFA